MSDLFPVDSFTLDEQINEVRRELAMREVVYPRLAQIHKMSKSDVSYRIACMRAVFETLKKAKEST